MKSKSNKGNSLRIRLICFIDEVSGDNTLKLCRVINEVTNEVKVMTVSEFKSKFVDKGLSTNMGRENVTKNHLMVCTEGGIDKIAKELRKNGTSQISGNKLMIIGKIKRLYKIVGYDGQVKIVDEPVIMSLISKGALFSNAEIRVKDNKPQIFPLRGRFKEVRISDEEEIKAYEMMYANGDIRAGYELGVKYYNNKKLGKAEEIFKTIRYPTPEQRAMLGRDCKKYALKCSMYLYRLELKKLEPDYQSAWFYLKSSELAISKDSRDRAQLEKYMRRLERLCLSDENESKSTVAALKDMYRDERFALYDIRKYAEMYEREIAIEVETVGGDETIDKMCKDTMVYSEDNIELLDIFDSLEVTKAIYYRGCMIINGYNDGDIDSIDEVHDCIRILSEMDSKKEKEWGIELKNRLEKVVKN